MRKDLINLDEINAVDIKIKKQRKNVIVSVICTVAAIGLAYVELNDIVLCTQYNKYLAIGIVGWNLGILAIKYSDFEKLKDTQPHSNNS